MDLPSVCQVVSLLYKPPSRMSPVVPAYLIPFTAQSKVEKSPPQTPKLPPRTGERAFIAVIAPMRRSPYGELLSEISRGDSSHIEWAVVPEPFYSVPDGSSDGLREVSMASDDVVTLFQHGGTHSHTECTPEVTQSNPWARISAVIHLGRTLALPTDGGEAPGLMAGSIRRGSFADPKA